MSEVNGGRCYLCGKWSDTLRYECIVRRYDLLAVYLCEECEIIPNEEDGDDSAYTDPE